MKTWKWIFLEGRRKTYKEKEENISRGNILFAEEETNWGGQYLEKDNTFLRRKKTWKRKIFFTEEKERRKIFGKENICFA